MAAKHMRSTKHSPPPAAARRRRRQRLSDKNSGDPALELPKEQGANLPHMAQAAGAVYHAQQVEQIKAAHERLVHLSHELLQAQEMERRYLARELHDEVGQALTALDLNLQTMRRLTHSRKILPLIDESLLYIEEALHQVRNLAFELHPAILDDLGLVAALEWYLTRVARAGLETHLHAAVRDLRPGSDLELTCYRVAQEALTNVMRHAHAQRVVVELKQLTRGGESLTGQASSAAGPFDLELSIADNGVGFETAPSGDRAARSTSLGLIGMRERVSLVGGTLHIQSAPGQGTVICARLPIAPPVASDLETSTDEVRNNADSRAAGG